MFSLKGPRPPSPPALFGRKRSRAAGAKGEAVALPDEVPERLLERYTLEDARRKWAATLAWREENNVDQCLATPHPFFRLISECYPLCCYSRARNGSVVVIDQLKHIRLEPMQAKGVELADLVGHSILRFEYLWNRLDPRPLGKMVSIVDLAGVEFSQFNGDVRAYLQRMMEITRLHYSNRADRVFVLNVPMFFRVVWGFLTPFLSRFTIEKTRVGVSTAELVEYIGSENLPREYGGTCGVPVGTGTAMEVELRAHVERVNQEAGVPFV